MFYIYIFVLCYVLGDAYGQKENKFFRNDYTYIESTGAFYKIHRLHKTWKEAKKACASEGASLFYPEDKHEADAVVNLMNETTTLWWLYIGVSDVLSRGVYVTIDGIPMKDIYNNWLPGKPNGSDVENCCILRRDSFILDDSCARQWPFVCKKPLDDVEWNTQCNMPNTDYEYNQKLDHCYKFHLNPSNWTEAFAACNGEQSYLAVINSPQEADYLRSLIAKSPKDNVPGN